MRLRQGAARRLVPLLLLLAAPAAGLEVDAYTAWQHQIEDSAEQLNEFLAASFAESITRANARPQKFDTCSDVSRLLFRRVFSSVFWKKPIFRFIGELPSSHKVEGGHFSEVYHSPYRYIPQLYFSSLSEVINVGGVYVGKDKITHVFGHGRRYYARYLSHLERGLTAEEAFAAVVRRGMRQESGWVGKRIDGIYSYADLEANYRGFELARGLCEAPGEGPVGLMIEGGPGAWRLRGRLDLRNVVNPLFDEGFNTPRYIRLYWPGVRRRLRQLCDQLSSPPVASRLASYRSRLPESRSEALIERLSLERHRVRREQHSVFTVCAPAERPEPVEPVEPVQEE